MRPRKGLQFATSVSVTACLVILPCEWSAFAQTAVGDLRVEVAESRGDTVPEYRHDLTGLPSSHGERATGTDAVFPARKPAPASGGLFDITAPRVAAGTDAETTFSTGVRGRFRAAVVAAVADGSARPALSVSNARASSAQGGSKNRAWMWILIAAGAGGAVAAVALLKDNEPDPSPTITVGTPIVGQ